ncbi:hypothetical protein JN531_016345 [Flagellatimonas centrodinii]|uniref:hypothetical protein n=1 Tax=Flagellatimonas centrodinii TaxID=2806210 RepID=UPI001FFA01DD|nr:hypothetical protein [Flagellatimonas centrodinii]ULQ46652.1 hypothetical protein JN531_016345 [Flagellatimonas centrodinii]
MLKRHPLWIAVPLGLLLLLQALAVAAAPISGDGADDGDTPMTMSPCHGDANASGDTPAAAECCDADCPHMAACALGHLAAATPMVASLARPATAATVVSVDRLILRPPTPQLRPPIVSHG